MSGGIGAWLIVDGHLTLAGMAVVTAVSCTFGMLSSLSRVESVKNAGVKQLLMNAGAIWLSAFVIANQAKVDVPGAAMIGLGVGLAGTKILEIIEKSVVTLTERLTGTQPVTRRELSERLGDERNKVQVAIAEVVKDKVEPIQKRQDEVVEKILPPLPDGTRWEDPAT